MSKARSWHVMCSVGRRHSAGRRGPFLRTNITNLAMRTRLLPHRHPLHLVWRRHAIDDVAKHRVLAIQMLVGLVGDEELAAVPASRVNERLEHPVGMQGVLPGY